METIQTILLSAIGAGVLFMLRDIKRRVTLIQTIQGRRTLSLMMVENELDTLHLSLMKLHDNAGNPEDIEWVRKRRKSLMKFRVEEGPRVPEILRGFEYPDMDDDKPFWEADLVAEMRLNADPDLPTDEN